jgi:hypothetical protein
MVVLSSAKNILQNFCKNQVKRNGKEAGAKK